MTTSTSKIGGLLAEFSGQFAGRIVEPDHAEYDTVRQVVPATIDKRPGVIVRPKDARDVVRAIVFARENSLELAIRSGGHSGAGHSTTDGGIVVDLRDMKALDINETDGTAWAETGLTAGEVSSAVTMKGLAIGFGDAATVGIGGITLGGGVGYLSRKYGLTIDSVLAAEIVTAGGEILTVDKDNHPDLFWAIRGGGGNFGIVTRIKYKLNPLPAFTGGMMTLPATAETISGFVAAAAGAPEELSTIANIMPAPPMPFLPAEWHGKPVILAMMAFAGDDAAAQEALKPFRALATPLADFVKPGSFMQMYPPEDPNYRPKAVAKTMFIKDVDQGTAATILDYLNKSDAPMRVTQLRVLGGAISRVAPDATAYAHRNSRIMVNVAAFFGGDEDKPNKEKWVDAFIADLDQGDAGAYVNFVADEGEARVRAAYPGATWERLRRIKAQYDPRNLFRMNHNIPPAA